MTAMRQTAFKAIADPTRREIISLLVAASEPLPITSITERFETTRQAVTKHIKVLHSAGLIQIRKQGRERYCSINALPLKEVHDWVVSYQPMWNEEQRMNEGNGTGHRSESDDDAKEHLATRRLALYRAVSAM